MKWFRAGDSIRVTQWPGGGSYLSSSKPLSQDYNPLTVPGLHHAFAQCVDLDTLIAFTKKYGFIAQPRDAPRPAHGATIGEDALFRAACVRTMCDLWRVCSRSDEEAAALIRVCSAADLWESGIVHVEGFDGEIEELDFAHGGQVKRLVERNTDRATYEQAKEAQALAEKGLGILSGDDERVIRQVEAAMCWLPAPAMHTAFCLALTDTDDWADAWDACVEVSSVVLTHVNEQIHQARVSPFLTLEHAGSATLTSEPRDLLGAVWLSLAREFSGQRRLKTCENCGKRFPLMIREAARTRGARSRSDARFCNEACRKAASRRRATARA